MPTWNLHLILISLCLNSLPMSLHPCWSWSQWTYVCISIPTYHPPPVIFFYDRQLDLNHNCSRYIYIQNLGIFDIFDKFDWLSIFSILLKMLNISKISEAYRKYRKYWKYRWHIGSISEILKIQCIENSQILDNTLKIWRLFHFYTIRPFLSFVFLTLFLLKDIILYECDDQCRSTVCSILVIFFIYFKLISQRIWWHIVL